MTTITRSSEKRTRNQKRPRAVKSKKCDGDTINGHTTCDQPEWIIVAGKEGDLWGIQKCLNCGGTISWGD